MLSKKKKSEFLLENGWSQWYHDDYWVNPAIVADETRQDYTNYGLTLEAAYKWQTETPDKKVGIPTLKEYK